MELEINKQHISDLGHLRRDLHLIILFGITQNSSRV